MYISPFLILSQDNAFFFISWCCAEKIKKLKMILCKKIIHILYVSFSMHWCIEELNQYEIDLSFVSVLLFLIICISLDQRGRMSRLHPY